MLRYFNELLMSVNLVFRVVPRPLTTATIASSNASCNQAVFDGGRAGFVIQMFVLLASAPS
jgi:hypothetical protein